MSAQPFTLQTFLTNADTFQQPMSAVQVNVRRDAEDDAWVDLGAGLRVSDGSNVVALDFGLFESLNVDGGAARALDAVRESRSKIQRLRNAVVEFEMALHAHLDEIEETVLDFIAEEASK